MEILFSPVGTTDPISYNHDGSMLHICRKYNPKHVFLYLSEEMNDIEEKDEENCDKRFTKSIELFNEKYKTSIDCHKIDGSKVKDVFNFDSYYNAFERELESIKEKFKHENIETIYLNTSSGTPAMKAALYVIAALDEDGVYKAIQVTTPNEKSNHSPRGYDLGTAWESNEDNKENAKDRTKLASDSNFLTKIKKEIIKKHIQQYDYNAAYELAKDLINDSSRDALSDKAIKAIKAAKERIALNYKEYAKYLIDSGVTSSKFMLDKYKDDKEDIKLYEYILSLDIKRKRREYADFIRAISPILRDIFKLYILESLNLDIYKYCYPINKKNTDSPQKLSRKKLNDAIKIGDKDAEKILNSLDDKFAKKNKKGNIVKNYNDTILAASNLSIVIKALGTDEDIKEKVFILRNLEEKVRNIAAHQVVAINDEQIKEASHGKDAEQIVKMIQDIAERAKIVPNDYNEYPSYIKNKKKYASYWDSYEAMNEYIINLIG